MRAPWTICTHLLARRRRTARGVDDLHAMAASATAGLRGRVCNSALQREQRLEGTASLVWVVVRRDSASTASTLAGAKGRPDGGVYDTCSGSGPGAVGAHESESSKLKWQVEWLQVPTAWWCTCTPPVVLG